MPKVREHFHGYRPKTAAQLAQIWGESIFSFDANILLHIYRLPAELTERLFSSWEKLGPDRRCLTFQVAGEFYKNRATVILAQQMAFQSLESNASKWVDSIRKDLQRHPSLDGESLSQELLHVIARRTDEARKSHQDLIRDDPWLPRLEELFSTVSDPCDATAADFVAEAERRFSKKLPPGYEDAKSKQGDNKFGDFAIWRELISIAKVYKRSVVWVSDDKKDDWWWNVNGRTLGPRPELIDEFYAETGSHFHMYTFDSYLNHFNKLSEKEREELEAARALAQSEEVEAARRASDAARKATEAKQARLRAERSAASMAAVREFLEALQRVDAATPQVRALQELAAGKSIVASPPRQLRPTPRLVHATRTKKLPKADPSDGEPGSDPNE